MDVPLLDLKAQYTPLRDEIQAAIARLCDTQSMILGPAVERFEGNLAAYCGIKHALGVSSGTDALLAAMMALDIGPGDEVIVPSFTFFATAGCVHRLGAAPVFAEILPDTFNLDPADVERRMTEKTKAIIPVDLFGQVADMERLEELATRHGLRCIEDAAQAIGAGRNGRKAGAFGTCGCLSFYPTKNLGAFGDAGAILCDDDGLYDRLRKCRVHGSGHTYYHEFVGGNFRIDAIQAEVLDIKLRHLESWNEGRRRNAALYDRLLAGSPVKTPRIADGNVSIYNQYVVRVTERDAVKAKLADAGIGTGVYYPLPLHLQACFAYLGGKEGDLPVTEQAAREVLALPICPELREEQVRYVADQLLRAVG